MENNHKTTLVELIAMTSLKVFKDIAGFFLVMIGLDDFGLLDIISLSISAFYFIMKGVRGNWNLLAELLEFVPYLGALPLSTAGFLADIMKMRKKAKKAGVMAVREETLEETVVA